MHNDDSYGGRVDWTISPSNAIFGRYNYSARYRFMPGYLGGIADGTSTSAWGRQNLTAQSVVTGWSYLFKASLVSDFHFGFIRNFSYAQQDPFGRMRQISMSPEFPTIQRSLAVCG